MRQGVKHWEIWNEPNFSAMWGPAADPARYLAVLESSYRSIKEVDPEATVITGGLGVTFTNGGKIAPQQFLTALYVGGGKPYFDGVAHHAYSFPALPSERVSWSGWSQMLEMRKIMVAQGDERKKIWITEYGAPTNGPGHQATDGAENFGRNPDHVSENYQATLVRQALTLYRTYDWAGPLFWYDHQDIGVSTDSNENFFGLLRADGSRKPAYEAFEESVAEWRSTVKEGGRT
jgi:endo-1,4-beta-mannosidase